MHCPNCKKERIEGAYRCEDCNYGFTARPEPKKHKPLYLGDTGMETRDEELGRTFRCTNCRSFEGKVKRIATTGAGFSRLVDVQNNEFIVVSCLFCGVIQMYDPAIIDSVSSGWPWVDFFTDFG